MKIFSNFDSNRKKDAYKEMVDKFGKENVLVLNKSFLFLLLKVLIPVFGGLVVLVVLWLPIYFSLDDSEFGDTKYYFTIFMFFAYFIIVFLLLPTVKYYLDYKMDFSIVTPEYLTRYNQTGFLRRDIKSSNVKNIKTITVEKNDFLYNIFNNGNLIFLSEGDRKDEGEILLHYIQDPEKKKKEITRIMQL